MVVLRSIMLLSIIGCSSVQTERAITAGQYFTPLALGVIALQSFGSDNSKNWLLTYLTKKKLPILNNSVTIEF